MHIDPALLDYCTPRQRELLQAAIDHGGLRAGARALGIEHPIISVALARAKKKAAASGHAPDMHHNGKGLPGFATDRVSAYYGKDGDLRGEWHIQNRQREQMIESLREFAEGLNETIVKAKPQTAPKVKYDADLMPTIFIGDAHIGMRAYGKETKHHDFDTDIAVTQLREAADYLIDKAEHAEIGMLVDVGDFHHANGHNNQTFAGTQVDVDTRHRSTMYQGAMAMRYIIDRMLTKFQKVVVVVARGNHNDDVAPAMELMLAFAYEDEPRVKVLETTGYYHYIEYGRNLLGVTHGDKQKAESLAGSMARDMPEAWGRTTFRIWCTGHYHKEAVKILPGCRHKVFAALPPPDSWHASHGYSGDGEMEMLTFRRSGGIQSSFVFNCPAPRIEPDVTL
jgi:hypothetical protein